MKPAVELPAGLLDRRLEASLEPEDASRIAYVAQLADRGEHAAAAREAAALIEAGVHDIRLIGFYLFGLFLQRGVAQLPALLARATALISEELASLRPSRRKLQVINSATAWLFEHVSSQLAFHARQRGATWDAWAREGDGGLPDAIAAGCGKLTAALEAILEVPLAAVPLARVRRWALEELRRSVARRERPEVEPDRTEQRAELAEVDDVVDDVNDIADIADIAERVEPVELPAAPPPRLVPAGAPVAIGSPALAALQAKLAGFQALVERGELARAAVIARDLRGALASFDPIAYFPSMFAGYFRTLHQVIDELAPYLDASEQPAWQALESYYRADLHGFLED